MNYNSKERDNAILLIGTGKADFKNIGLYEDLENHSWISICRLDGIINKVALTFWGKRLFNRLQNLSQANDTKKY